MFIKHVAALQIRASYNRLAISRLTKRPGQGLTGKHADLGLAGLAGSCLDRQRNINNFVVNAIRVQLTSGSIYLDVSQVSEHTKLSV